MNKLLQISCAFFAALGAFFIFRAGANYIEISRARQRTADTKPVILTLDTTEKIEETDYIKAKYPTDVLFESEGRQMYTSGEMTLTVPRLGLESCAVLSGTDDATLEKSVGLFDVSQLPNDKAANENVVIAGHRGAAGCEFYNIDEMGAGDVIILEYKGVRYTYIYEETLIVANDDWTPVYCRSYECVTLVSCHPQNSSAQRICAVGRLALRESIRDADASTYNAA